MRAYQINTKAASSTNDQQYSDMKNDSSLNITANESTLILLPIGAVAFAPFLLLELVAAIVSNAILLALVILACVKKLNNNINIYLFSLAIGGLIGAFNIFSLLVLVVMRHWALGSGFCYLNRFVIVTYSVLFHLVYLVISFDKLKIVKDPLHGYQTNKRGYVISAIIWMASISSSVIISISMIWRVARETSAQEFFLSEDTLSAMDLWAIKSVLLMILYYSQ